MALEFSIEHEDDPEEEGVTSHWLNIKDGDRQYTIAIEFEGAYRTRFIPAKDLKEEKFEGFDPYL